MKYSESFSGLINVLQRKNGKFFDFVLKSETHLFSVWSARFYPCYSERRKTLFQEVVGEHCVPFTFISLLLE